MNITTAQEAHADGIHPGELFRAARFNERESKQREASALRAVARELAAIMGLHLRSRPARNDNYKRAAHRRTA